MRMRLSPAEQETVIRWDNELDVAYIYTLDNRMIRRLQQMEQKYPGMFVLERRGPGKAVSYRVPKSLICLRAPVDEKVKENLRERALRENYRERFGQQRNS